MCQHVRCLIYSLTINSLSDQDYFRNPSRQVSLAENWVLRFSALKRLYRLMIQYFTDALHQHATGLEVPNLQAMAKDSDVNAIILMCRLAIVIAVQSTKNREIIDRIQQLSQDDQHNLMKAIEHVSQLCEWEYRWLISVPGDDQSDCFEQPEWGGS